MASTSPEYGSIIRVLDHHTANRIAAGEVVERPASVIKELVENSIDAGATQISITLEEGGKELMKVVDNGIGMTREDVVLSLRRHATSKIRTADDLEAIATLGFRGEALPSIASVSVMEIITKHESEMDGVRLEIEAGTITKHESVGAPQGTTMAVKRLFFNTPARLKFLKSAQTEQSHITEMVGRFAMAYPHITFRLTSGGRDIISSPGTGISLNSVTQILGKDTAKQLVPILFETAVMKISGFISNPSLTRINRRDQIFFVNGRPIKSSTITHALDTAYRGLLPPGRYPIAVIFVDLVPQLVDVNVHPTKSEVKFSSEHEIHSAVHRAANEALMQGAAAPTITAGPSHTPQHSHPLNLRPDEPHYRQTQLLPSQDVDIAAFREALAKRRQEAIDSQAESADPFVWNKGSGVPMEDSPVPEADIDTLRTVGLTGVKVIGQARNTYILAQCDDGVLIIDQHVAHERVLFDRMRKSKEERGSLIQGLIVPITITLSARESAVVEKRIDELRKVGFDLEAFGGNAFVMRGAPAGVKQGDAELVLKDTIQELVDLSVAKHLLVKPDQVLITASCKMAVKAGDPLSMSEMERLIADLLECENPFVCPHGRPVIVSLSNWELDRKFHRA